MEIKKMNSKNPIGLNGIPFVELATREPKAIESLFYTFGYSTTMKH